MSFDFAVNKIVVKIFATAAICPTTVKLNFITQSERPRKAWGLAS